ncbi:MAG: TAXI family TRAP transporter solute-binding subunit [Gemmatimonas sp.]
MKATCTIATRLAAAVIAAAIAAAPALAQRAPPPDVQFFRIGTGPTTGVYFPVGAMIASVVSNPPGSRPCDRGGSCGVPNLIAVAQATQDSIARLKDIADARIESGLVQSDVAYLAYRGEGPFAKQPLRNLRAIARLYPEYLHVVVRTDAKVRSFADLKGKRVGLDVDGSGTRIMTQAVLPQLGIRSADVSGRSVPVSQAADQLRAQRLDAFAFASGIPAEPILRLLEDVPVALLPVRSEVAAKVAKGRPGLGPGVIPAGAYRGIAETPTVVTDALWVVSADADPNLVYALARALWNPNNRRLLDAGHPAGRSMRLENAMTGLTIPLHAGAEQFYRDAGLDIPTTALAPQKLAPAAPPKPTNR